MIRHVVLKAVFILFLSASGATADPFRVDADISDWAGIAPAFVDPTGDVPITSLGVGSDLTAVFLAVDGSNLYLRFDHTGGPVFVQIELNTDQNLDTDNSLGEDYAALFWPSAAAPFIGAITDFGTFGMDFPVTAAFGPNVIEAVIPFEVLRVLTPTFNGALDFRVFPDWGPNGPNAPIRFDPSLDPVPEPATMFLLGTGLLGIALERSRQKRT